MLFVKNCPYFLGAPLSNHPFSYNCTYSVSAIALFATDVEQFCQFNYSLQVTNQLTFPIEGLGVCKFTHIFIPHNTRCVIPFSTGRRPIQNYTIAHVKAIIRLIILPVLICNSAAIAPNEHSFSFVVVKTNENVFASGQSSHNFVFFWAMNWHQICLVLFTSSRSVWERDFGRNKLKASFIPFFPSRVTLSCLRTPKESTN